MSKAAALVQITKDITAARSRRSLFGHGSMEGKRLTREIQFLMALRLSIASGTR